VFAPVVERAGELARRGDGEVLVFDARPGDQATGLGLQEAFRRVREDEWAEFTAECGRFEAEIAKELRKGKLTAAELEEEEHSLERLRRWYRELKTRDVLGLAAAVAAEGRLKACSAVLEDYAERVYQAIHNPATAGGEGGDA
jgi:hypothetical protein